MVNVADTSFLASLYIEQGFTERARDIARGLDQPLRFTPLHRYELRMAIRLAVFRRQINAVQRAKVFALITSDLEQNILVHAPLSWTDLLREADAIGEAHVETVGARSIDTLHVAAAILLKATNFFSFDTRQRELAKRAGLKVRP